MSDQKHPPGLYTLFFTEMWERFSYYGMRALLVLFMVDAVQRGGLGFDDKTATAIYGLYTAMVYLVSLPGGWVADRLLGAQRAVWYGGIIIALGHFTLAIPGPQAFFGGLALVVIGTGLLKPNISVIVGHLYPEGGARRDAGFTIFYMGINLGAAFGPLICSLLGEKLNWHYGFAAAGVGMVLGLVQYRLMQAKLGESGLHPSPLEPGQVSPKAIAGLACLLGGIGLLVLGGLIRAGVVTLDPVHLAHRATYLIVGIATAYFAAILLWGKLDRNERRRTILLAVLLLAAAMFWAGFEQAGSSLNLFAERYTQRVVPGVNYEVPAGWFQSFNPVFIITLSPVVAWLWLWLSRRGQNPSVTAKFAWGLILLGLGFLVMAGGSSLIEDSTRVWPTWLISTYLLHTLGELCLSPVGLSAVTKLAPPRFVGQMMGLWFVATSLGNLIAGLFAGEFATDPAQMPAAYLRIVVTAVGTGLVLLVLVRPIHRWVGKME